MARVMGHHLTFIAQRAQAAGQNKSRRPRLIAQRDLLFGQLVFLLNSTQDGYKAVHIRRGLAVKLRLSPAGNGQPDENCGFMSVQAKV